MKRSPRFIYLFLLCADGHAGITAATAAAGTGGLLLLLVFPEKERVIFQCLHILCAAQEDISEIRLDGRPVQFAVQFLQLGSGLGEQQERRPVLAQDGRQLLEVTHLEGGHLVQDKIQRGTLFSMENEREAILITMAMTGDITDSVA